MFDATFDPTFEAAVIATDTFDSTFDVSFTTQVIVLGTFDSTFDVSFTNVVAEDAPLVFDATFDESFPQVPSTGYVPRVVFGGKSGSHARGTGSSRNQ